MLSRRAISLLLLAAYLPACTAYHQTSVPLAELTAAPKPVARVRVTTPDGKRVQIWDPRVAFDSVVGVKGAPGKDTARVAVSLGDVRKIEVKQVDGAMTLVEIAGTTVGVSLFFAAILNANCSSSSASC